MAFIGPYRIVGSLGAGGMGQVYRARDGRLDRDVAIKTIAAGLTSNPDRVDRFTREAKAAAALNHPNILAVHDVGVHDGEPFLVTELLDGRTLRRVLAARRPRKAEAIEWILQICEGLTAAHERGIVHRDLKPENLFLTTSGRIKILDLGLAKLVEPREASGVAPDAATVAYRARSRLPPLADFHSPSLRGDRYNRTSCGCRNRRGRRTANAFVFPSSRTRKGVFGLYQRSAAGAATAELLWQSGECKARAASRRTDASCFSNSLLAIARPCPPAPAAEHSIVQEGAGGHGREAGHRHSSHHVKQPSVPRAGVLGDPQAIRAVVPAPNQCGGNRDACEIVRRVTRDPECTKQPTSDLRAGPTGAFEAVG